MNFALLHLWAFILLGLVGSLGIRYARRDFRKNRSLPAAGSTA